MGYPVVIRTLDATWEGWVPYLEMSDIDLLIVKETSLPFWQRLRQVALLCRASVGVDYLIYTPDELAAMIEEQNPFILDVLEKGKVLYDRQVVSTMA